MEITQSLWSDHPGQSGFGGVQVLRQNRAVRRFGKGHCQPFQI